MKLHPPIGEPPAVQYFGPERLQVDATYQRSTRSHGSQRLIQEIAQKWDWRLCTPLLVANRDGGFYIIDGQHRWEAAKLRGDIPFLPCAVGNYTGSAEEAALFVAANRHRVRVNPMDMWRAALAAHDTATVTLEEMVRKAGLAIASSPHHHQLKPGELLCTKALYSALRVHGEDKVGKTLQLLGHAFKDQVVTHSGLMFAAVLGFFTNPAENPADKAALGCIGDALEASSADEWASHPALDGVFGARSRGLALRKVILEVAAMIADDGSEAVAA